MIESYNKYNAPSLLTLNNIAALYKSCNSQKNEPNSELYLRSEWHQISKLLQETKIITLSIKDDIIGILEYKEKEVKGWLYLMLVWLIIDEPFRDQGYSSILHNTFEDETSEIITSEKVCKLLSVNRNNQARNIYKKWGYKSLRDETSSSENIFMYKDY